MLVRSILSTLLALAFIAQPVRADDDERILDKLPRHDRALLDELVGYAPPPLTADLTWVGSKRETWDSLRSRVVVLQSWSARSGSGRKAKERLDQELEEIAAKAKDDLRVIYVQTPDGADKVERYLEQRPSERPVVVDSRGDFCDTMGFYKRPTNVVVDRNGTVRYAGLTEEGVAIVAEKLLAEPFDQSKPPKEREAGEAVAFPQFSVPVANAKDLRGQRAPDFYVQSWVNGRPTPGDNVVIIDFWATWCGPCVKMIPHMNDLARRYPDDVTIVGLSDESNGAFRSGMSSKLSKQGISLNTFQYALALDSTGRMKQAVGITAIPHVLVMSKDWIVRWQGHPSGLTHDVLESIVKANNGAGGGARVPGRNRWADDR